MIDTLVWRELKDAAYSANLLVIHGRYSAAAGHSQGPEKGRQVTRWHYESMITSAL
jgi:hypothetical protein